MLVVGSAAEGGSASIAATGKFFDEEEAGRSDRFWLSVSALGSCLRSIAEVSGSIDELVVRFVGGVAGSVSVVMSGVLGAWVGVDCWPNSTG